MKRIAFLFVLIGVCAAIMAGGLHRIQTHTITVTTDTTADCTTSVTYGLTSHMYHYNDCRVSAILRASPVTTHGYGNDDTCILTLKSDFGGVATTLACDTGGVPGTLLVAMNEINDSLFGSNLYIDIVLCDSVSDTIITATHQVEIEFLAKEE